MSAQSVIDEFKMPNIGRCIAGVFDEYWQDEYGVRSMQLWATEVCSPLPSSDDAGFRLALDRAAERYVFDMKQYAEANSISIQDLITCPVRCTAPEERGGAVRAYLYGRVGQLEHDN